MAWHRSDDAAFYADAGRLQRHVGPGWLVMWGPGSRRFWAFRCGAPTALIRSDRTIQGLYPQTQRAELHQR